MKNQGLGKTSHGRVGFYRRQSQLECFSSHFRLFGKYVCAQTMRLDSSSTTNHSSGRVFDVLLPWFRVIKCSIMCLLWKEMEKYSKTRGCSWSYLLSCASTIFLQTQSGVLASKLVSIVNSLKLLRTRGCSNNVISHMVAPAACLS